MNNYYQRPIILKQLSPKGFTLGVKAEIGKIFSICPKLLMNAEIYGVVLAPRLKKRIPSILGSQFATLGGPMFQHLLVTWGAKQQAKKMLKVGPKPINY
jgi:hypothetical protein